MTIRWLRGDCRETLATLDAGSVQTVISSPPYWGLRDYGTSPLVWGGDAEHGRHEWGANVPPRGKSSWDSFNDYRREGFNNKSAGGKTGAIDETTKASGHGQFCPCGAWLGSLGLEPTPELFIEHLVDVFRGVRRVLRDDGCIFINLGDSYSGSGNGSNDYRENGSSLSKDDRKYQGQRPGTPLRAKNLMMLPARVAIALQADGWYLRSQIPWLKRNAMPESVTDRPATAVEYIYLLSKSRTYFFDADAVRQPLAALPHAPGNRAVLGDAKRNDFGTDRMAAVWGSGAGRNRRNSDWFFESWQGLMLDEAAGPLAFVVNPTAFKGSHFATFPPKLVEPMVKAGSRAGDTVLDPFAGAGTSLMVADRLGRNAIGCELSESYGDMGTARVVGDAPMFTELVS